MNHQYKSIYCSTLFLNILLVCIGIHLLMHLCPHDWGHSCPHGDEVSTWGIVVLGGGRGWWKRPKSTKTQPLKINPGNSEILDKIHEKICGVINTTITFFFLLSLSKVLLSKLLLTGHSAPYLLPKVMKWQKKNCLVFNEPLLFGIHGYLSSSTALSPPEVLSGLFCCCITGPGDWLAEVFPLL